MMVLQDIYKTHLSEGKQQTAAKVDSARANLASTIVNAFVNAGSGADKLMTVADGMYCSLELALFTNSGFSL